MLYFLDTNIISYLLEGRQDILKKFLEAEKNGEIKIPCIAYYEVFRGLLCRDKKKLLASFDNFCSHYGIVSMTTLTMQIAAKNYATLKKSGQLIEDADILIGSHAVENSATIVTNNFSHLSRIPQIKIIRW